MGCKDVKRRQKGLQSKAKSIGTARRYIEGAIVEESRRGKKMESPFASRSVLLLAFITLDLLNWNFDPIKLCLPLAAMASSKPPLLSRRQLHSLSLSKHFISELGHVSDRRKIGRNSLASHRRRPSPLPVAVRARA